MSGVTRFIGLRLAKRCSDMENLLAASLSSAVSASGTPGITDTRPSDSKTLPAKAGSAASEFQATLDHIGKIRLLKRNDSGVIMQSLQTHSSVVRSGESYGKAGTAEEKTGIEEKPVPTSQSAQPGGTGLPEQAVATSTASELTPDTELPVSHPKETRSQSDKNSPETDQDKTTIDSLPTLIPPPAPPEVPLPSATPSLLPLPQMASSLGAVSPRQGEGRAGPARLDAEKDMPARTDADAEAATTAGPAAPGTMQFTPASPFPASARSSDAIMSQDAAAMHTLATASASPVVSVSASHHAEPAKPSPTAVTAGNDDSAPARAADPLQANLSAVSGGNNISATRPPEAAVSADRARVTVPQVTPALISLATRTDGGTEMTVSLNPHELGQVEIHMVRGTDGTTTVSITASRPETLQELSQNVHHLHAALDAANVPPDGRTMNFIETPTSNQNNMLQGMPASGGGVQTGDVQIRETQTGGTQTGGTQAGTDGSGGQNQGQAHAWRQDRQDHTSGGQDGGTGSYLPSAPLAYRRSWQISSLNITA